MKTRNSFATKKILIAIWSMIIVNEVFCISSKNMLAFWFVKLLFSLLFLIPVIMLYKAEKPFWKNGEYIFYFLYSISAPIFYICYHLLDSVKVSLHEPTFIAVKSVLGSVFLIVAAVKLVVFLKDTVRRKLIKKAPGTN